MIELQFSSVYCNILNTSLDPVLEEGLFNLLSYHPEGYFYSPKYQSGVWDGLVHLYQPKHKRFKTGLLNRVIKYLKDNNLDYHITDLPPSSEFLQKHNTYKLRPYQETSVRKILSSRFGILEAPPRSGKTVIMIATVDSEQKFPVVFFCRNLDLAYQTREKIQFFLPDLPVGLVGDGNIQCEEQGITIATIQSVFSAYGKKYELSRGEPEEKPISDRLKLKKLLAKAKIAFYDECHHGGGKTSKFVLDNCASLQMRIGLSATPFSDSENELINENALGEVIHKISYSELIRDGYILAPTIYLYKLPKLLCEGTYPSVYKKAVIENSFLEGLIFKIVKKIINKGKSVVLQTEYINHSIRLGKLLNCEVLTGKDTTEKRKDIIDKLKRKEILCLVSTLFEEGLDIPSLSYTINVAGGLSNISTLQRMRSITADNGKTSCGIVDFQHQCKYLSRHSLIRKNLYEAEPEFKLNKIDVSKKTLEEIS